MVEADAPAAGEQRMDGDVMRLPTLPNHFQGTRREIVSLRGLNLTDNIQDGDMAACKNISARRYPYFSQRRARQVQSDYTGVTALTSWGKLVAVRGTDLLYDGQVVGAVTAGEKQFAVVNTKLIIWPDKVYLDIDSLTVKSLGATAAGTGAAFTTDTMTVSGWPDLTTLFKAGDAITISGCTEKASNNKSVVIKSLTATSITISANGFTEATETASITLERKIPDLDYICESENRLWGCSNKDKTIYASSLGDPTNFYVYEGLATDGYALAVGSEGDFTGCCKLSTSVLFWKETVLHKMLGSYPSEYSLYTYNIEGLRKGCHKSLQVINEVLFYMGLHGVYAYSGGTPSLISSNFGRKDFTDAVAGTDGDSYYLSVLDGEERHLLLYDSNTGLWLREDDTRCVDFARIGKQVYFLTDGGDVYLSDNGSDDPEVPWEIQLTPFYETADGKKRYRRLIFRVEIASRAWMRVFVRYDGGAWREAGKAIGGQSGLKDIQIVPKRCDRFEIKLSGKGPCIIKDLIREFFVGGDR